MGRVDEDVGVLSRGGGDVAGDASGGGLEAGDEAVAVLTHGLSLQWEASAFPLPNIRPARVRASARWGSKAWDTQREERQDRHGAGNVVCRMRQEAQDAVDADGRMVS